jgi:hypothetical protein
MAQESTRPTLDVIKGASVLEATVTPGNEATVDLPIRNRGQVVDELSLEVLGDAAGWATIEPASIRLFPGADAVAHVTFRPPRTPEIHAGSIPFGVLVSSKESPDATVVEEGVLTVGAFTETAAELLPTASHGRSRGIHRVAVDNRGNVPLKAELVASDPTGGLNFRLRPQTLSADPGTAVISRLQAVPRKKLWWGRAKPPKQFQVSVNPANEPPIVMVGTMVQEALIPRWSAAAALGLIGLLAAAAVLWMGLLKPTIDSAAKKAGQQAAQAAVAAPLAKQDEKLKQQDDAQKKQADQIAKLQPAQAGANGGAASGGNGATTGNQQPSGNALGAPFDGRLNAKDPELVVSKGTLSVTDIFFENPDGATGTLKLVRVDGGAIRDLKLERLDNFRDYDIHFVSPITLTEGQKLRVIFDGCKNGSTSQSGQGCSASVYFTGYLKS